MKEIKKNQPVMGAVQKLKWQLWIHSIRAGEACLAMENLLHFYRWWWLWTDHVTMTCIRKQEWNSVVYQWQKLVREEKQFCMRPKMQLGRTEKRKKKSKINQYRKKHACCKKTFACLKKSAIESRPWHVRDNTGYFLSSEVQVEFR